MICCLLCRDVIPDLDTISPAEAERLQSVYKAQRAAYRERYPALTRQDIEARSAR